MGQATQSGKSRRAERIRCWAHSGPPVRIFNQSVTTTTGDSATGNESLQVGAWFGVDIWLNRIQGSRRQREAAHPKGRRRSDSSCPPGSKGAQHDQALKSAAAPLEELALALAMSPSQSAERETPLAMTDGHGSAGTEPTEAEASHSGGRDGRCTRHHLQRHEEGISSVQAA